MNIVTWNVNSIKARLEHAQRFLKENAPDVLMMQELKTEDFPASAFEGYQAVFAGQKTYNGVAVLSKNPIKIILERLPGDDEDTQARYLECETAGVRIINIYLPNGNPVESEKYPYKLRWMDRLYAHLKNLRDQNIPFIVGGDFNIIPEDQDCHDPKTWAEDALFRLESRAKFRRLLNLGLTDAFRIFDTRPKQYSYWDYQAGARPKNYGIRIDHFLLSPEMADRARACRIDDAPRDWEKPSDHVPVILKIAA
jgi:exodeoxyribonuclease-3